MVTVTIEREGYKVEGLVLGQSGAPDFGSYLDVDEILRMWIHDPEAFKEAHGLDPTDANLDAVIDRESRAITDDLVDAAQSEIESNYDPEEVF